MNQYSKICAVEQSCAPQISIQVIRRICIVKYIGMFWYNWRRILFWVHLFYKLVYQGFEILRQMLVKCGLLSSTIISISYLWDSYISSSSSSKILHPQTISSYGILTWTHDISHSGIVIVIFFIIVYYIIFESFVRDSIKYPEDIRNIFSNFMCRSSERVLYIYWKLEDIPPPSNRSITHTTLFLIMEMAIPMENPEISGFQDSTLGCLVLSTEVIPIALVSSTSTSTSKSSFLLPHFLWESKSCLLLSSTMTFFLFYFILY